jgi:hypothetical protein
MRKKLFSIVAFSLSLFLLFCVACDNGDDDNDSSSRKGDDLNDDSQDVLDDDASADDDDGDDDNDSDDDDWFNPDDDDDDDDDWFNPDDDDDSDDDVDDDNNPYGPGVIGWVVGENNDADEAFIGFVSEDRVARRPLSASHNIRLHAIDMSSDSFGFTVGFNYETFEGVVFEIDNDVLTKVVTPSFDAWGLYDVALPSEDLGYMVGFQVVGEQMQGVILRYDGSSIDTEVLPEIAGSWKLNSVAITADYEIWAVGFNDTTNQPVILLYNGFNWNDFELPSIGEYAQLNEVATDSFNLAVAVGGKIAAGDSTMRGFALTFEGEHWIESWSFAGDGVLWSFHNLDVLSEDEAVAYVAKSDRLEEWEFNGTQWQRQMQGLTLPNGSVIESNSMHSRNNGLIAVRNDNDRTGLVIQKYSSVYSKIEDVPSSMGHIYDVIALDKQ